MEAEDSFAGLYLIAASDDIPSDEHEARGRADGKRVPRTSNASVPPQMQK